jgi:drug/metabolite transporter (DMT)-like permease
MATSAIIIRLSTAAPMVIGFYRVLFTFALALLLGGRQTLHECQQLNKKEYQLIIGAGIFLALHFSFWITSLDYTSVSSSVLFTNLQVIFVLLFSVFILREKLNYWIAGGILVALAGSFFIGTGDLANGKIWGDMLALASGVFIAIYFIFGRKVRIRVGIWTYTAVVSLVAAVLMLAASLAMGLNMSNYPAHEWLLFFLLALGPGIAGHGILNWALKYVKAPIVSVSILGESVGASLMAWILFGEFLSWYQIIGGLFILTGICMAASHEQPQ